MKRIISTTITALSLALSSPPSYAEPIPGESPMEGFLSQMYADADQMDLFEVIPLNDLAPKTMLGYGAAYCSALAGDTKPAALISAIEGQSQSQPEISRIPSIKFHLSLLSNASQYLCPAYRKPVLDTYKQRGFLPNDSLSPTPPINTPKS